MGNEERFYAILTTDSNRIEVKAINVDQAFRIASKKLKRMKDSGKYSLDWISDKSDITRQYMTFGKDGINFNGFIINKSSQKAYEKYKLVR